MTGNHSSPRGVVRASALFDHRAWRQTCAGLIAVAMLITPGIFAPAVAHADNDAMAVTQSVVNQALQILGNTAEPLPQRRRELRGLVEQHFDFRAMSRSALGYNWRSLSEDQHQQFTKLFTAFIEVAYLDKIQDYQGQQVRFTGQHSLGEGYVQVDTQILEPGKSPVSVNYLLEQTGGTWKVYDVTVEAISIIANYRNQFNRIIQQKGFDQLMADLQAKQQQLASLLGEG
jgi:phospholipid transport system substrate-binding protein